MIGTLLELLALQPLASVTMTFRVTEPDGPAANVIDAVPDPETIVPFAIDQL